MLQVRGLVELAGKALCWMYAKRIPAAGAVPAAADFNAIATPSKWSVGLMVIEGVIEPADVSTWYSIAKLSRSSAVRICQGLAPAVQLVIVAPLESCTAPNRMRSPATVVLIADPHATDVRPHSVWRRAGLERRDDYELDGGSQP